MCTTAALVTACGSSGGNSNTSGTGTVPTTPSPTNHAPTISVTTNQVFGISQLTLFTFTSAVLDPDGDPVTVTWDFGDGAQGAGNAANHTFNGSGGPMTVVGVATDSKGAQGTGSTSVTIGSMTGSWLANVPTCGTFTLSLIQSGGTIAGTFLMPSRWCAVPSGTPGKTDPAEPGTIDANGNVQIRFKVGKFLDSYFRGKMDSTGRTVTGGMFQSGFSGDIATLTKQ